LAAFFVAAVFLALPVAAQQRTAPAPPPTTPYRPPISLEAAKKVMAAAEAEAIKNTAAK
jgi:glc operon protein GlcG